MSRKRNPRETAATVSPMIQRENKASTAASKTTLDLRACIVKRDTVRCQFPEQPTTSPRNRTPSHAGGQAEYCQKRKTQNLLDWHRPGRACVL
jgi:hypothetical protein